MRIGAWHSRRRQSRELCSGGSSSSSGCFVCVWTWARHDGAQLGHDRREVEPARDPRQRPFVALARHEFVEEPRRLLATTLPFFLITPGLAAALRRALMRRDVRAVPFFGHLLDKLFRPVCIMVQQLGREAFPLDQAAYCEVGEGNKKKIVVTIDTSLMFARRSDHRLTSRNPPNKRR